MGQEDDDDDEHRDEAKLMEGRNEDREHKMKLWWYCTEGRSKSRNFVVIIKCRSI